MKLSICKKIIFSLVVLLIFLIVAELGIRVILFLTPLGNKSLNLDPYEEPDPNFGWRLKANYQNIRFSPDTKTEETLIINSKGFRGKEFNKEKKADVIRIIAMGDSVTFGITPETCPYSVQLQELFNQKYSNKVEVINAGVEGYSSEYVLKRLKYDILQYKPDIITVYVGWNDLYAVNPLSPWNYKKFSGLANFLNKFYLYKGSRKIIFQWLKPQIDKIISQDNSNQEIKSAYQNFEPVNYKENLRQIIEISKENKIQIIFINLASILSEKMSQEDIKKVHYPYFTSDIEKLKMLQDRYNKAIEDIAKEEQVTLIDLNKAINQIPDKGRLFFDTMHPYCAGQKIIAETIFNNLISQKLLNLVE
jgi:lysophospholipase L1-like esterase